MDTINCSHSPQHLDVSAAADGELRAGTLDRGRFNNQLMFKGNIT